MSGGTTRCAWRFVTSRSPRWTRSRSVFLSSSLSRLLSILTMRDDLQNWFYWTWRTLPSTTHLPPYAAKVGVDLDAGAGRRYLLEDVELGAWKVGRPGSTYGGRVPLGAAESHRAAYPAGEFDTPSRGWNGGGLPVAGLWAYAREGDAPVLESPVGAEGPTARAAERKWASRRPGCRYPGSWGAPVGLEQVGLVPPECSVAHAIERGEL